MNLLRHFLVAATALAAVTGTAFAADLPIRSVPEAAPAPTSTWDGFYAGIFGGYEGGTLLNTDPALFTPTVDYPSDYSGYLVGVQAGYNFHLTGNIVGGFGVDIAYNNGYGVDDSYTPDLAWSGSVTGRIGADLGGITPYLVGGVALANASVTDRHAPVGNVDSQTHVGYTVGAGVDFALADNVSADIEYRYTDYAGKTYNLTNPTYDSKLHDNSVRVGLNYHMN